MKFYGITERVGLKRPGGIRVRLRNSNSDFTKIYRAATVRERFLPVRIPKTVHCWLVGYA
jgi:hypothetical protein